MGTVADLIRLVTAALQLLREREGRRGDRRGVKGGRHFAMNDKKSRNA